MLTIARTSSDPKQEQGTLYAVSHTGADGPSTACCHLGAHQQEAEGKGSQGEHPGTLKRDAALQVASEQPCQTPTPPLFYKNAEQGNLSSITISLEECHL